MHTLTAIAMALAFVLSVFIFLLILYIPFRFIYKLYTYVKNDISNEDTNKHLFKGYFTNTKLLKKFAIFFFTIHVVVYSSERIRLVNDDRVYLDAKEYFAASGVVTLYRKILNNYTEVDNPIMIPLNSAHMMFYKKGIELIPQSDGEYDYWKYRFNLYYYVRKHYVPWNDKKSGYMFGTMVYKFYKPVLRELMDESYRTIEAMMKKPFKDKVLLNDERYRLLTRLSVFYTIYVLNTYQLNCAVQTECSLLYSKDKVLPQRDEMILSYMHQAVSFFEKNNIEDRASHIADSLFVLEQIITLHLDEVIGRDLFACDNYYVQEYIKVHRQFEKLTKDKEYYNLPKALRERLYEREFFLSSLSYVVSSLAEKECNVILLNKLTELQHFPLEKMIKNKKERYNEQ